MRVTHATYQPGGAAEKAMAPEETVFVILDSELETVPIVKRCCWLRSHTRRTHRYERD
ncbi:MAG TPA: hypothetical protein VMB04_08195 [Mycobacterium sp.]|nr:hypothetical protein [Mycobacterium sp.]